MMNIKNVKHSNFIKQYINKDNICKLILIKENPDIWISANYKIDHNDNNKFTNIINYENIIKYVDLKKIIKNIEYYDIRDSKIIGVFSYYNNILTYFLVNPFDMNNLIKNYIL